MSELGPEEQRWLDALRAVDEPSDADRARVRAAVLASVAGGSAASFASATATSATTATTATGTTAAGAAGTAAATGVATKTGALAAFASWKIGAGIAALVVVGGASAITLSARAPAHEPEVAPVETTTSPHGKGADLAPAAASPPSADDAPPATAGTEEAHVVNASDVAPAASAPSTEAKRGPRAAPPSTHARAAEVADVDAELQLLATAQKALGRGDAEAALTTLAKHRREHPSGALAIERDGLHAIASCQAKRAGSRALADRFIARHPTSPLVARVRATCETR